MKKRVGIVGCGSIARVHIQALKQVEEVEVAAFADCKMEKADMYNKTYGNGHAGAYQSLTEMLASELLDVVHICTPHYLHVPMAQMVLEKGISVFMEKPPAISRHQFRQLETEECESKGKLGICFQNRYNDSTVKVDELLRSGRLGEIIGIRAFVTWNRDKSYYTESDWRGKWDTEGGGALINQSVHTLDLILRWLGVPKVISASLNNHHLKGTIEVEDTMEVFMEFQTGQRACFYSTTGYAVDAPVIIELNGNQGCIQVEGDRVRVYYHDGEETEYLLKHHNSPGKSCWGSGHDACIADFYQCLRQGVVSQCSLDSVKNTFDVMMKIYEAARREED